jgi:hypothetical protein
MRKGIIAAILVFGAIAFGAAAAPAQASSSHYTCHNGVTIGLVNCSAVVVNVPVTITIKGNRTLTDNETSILDNNLNNLGNDTNVSDIKAVIISTYESFDPKIIITGNDINVCVASLCA